MERTNLSEAEKLEARLIIQKNTGYMIRSRVFLNQIFRRSSLAAQTGQHSNEILEFIGDQILSYYVVKIVSKRCGAFSLTTGDYTFRIRENRFTQIKQMLVSNEAFAEIIDRWGIEKFLLLGKSDIKNEITKETKVKADLFEAIIGAIAVDSDWNSEVLEKAVAKALDMETRITALIESDSAARDVDMDNAVTVLKELAEKSQCSMPTYTFTGPDQVGYDKDGTPKWYCWCQIINDQIGISKTVKAGTKKDAKKAAAYLVLCEQLGMQNKYGRNVPYFAQWVYNDGKLFPDNNESGGEES